MKTVQFGRGVIMGVIVLASSSITFAQNLEISTPPSETLVWKNERDLLVLIQQAEDRVALANTVLAMCIDNSPPLSEGVRVDGLRIAGAVLFRDGELVQAKSAFSTIVNITSEPTWLAEAHRMLGQICYSQSEFANALIYFDTSVTNALIEDPEGIYISTQSSIEQAAAVANILGDYQTGLDFATIGLALYPDPVTPVDPSGPFLYWAYASAKGLNDNSLAVQYLDELLDRHPTYGEDNLVTGMRPMLLIEQYELRGEGWNTPSQAFFDALTAIVTSDKYVLMPIRTAIAERFAQLLADHSQTTIAAKISDFALRSTADAVSAADSLEPFLVRSLGEASGQLALQNVIRKRKAGDAPGAVETLAIVLDSELMLSDELRTGLEAAYFEITQQQYQPLP